MGMKTHNRRYRLFKKAKAGISIKVSNDIEAHVDVGTIYQDRKMLMEAQTRNTSDKPGYKKDDEEDENPMRAKTLGRL